VQKPHTGNDPASRTFPTGAGILFGLGLGGFFDGIMLHQVLQWHHVVSSAYPPDNLANLKLNTLIDGLFHTATYVLVALGLAMFWRTARKSHFWWSGKLMIGSLLVGFGLFNLAEGIIDHEILCVHHLNETVPREQWIYWDVGFLIWGAAMLIGGWMLFRAGRQTSLASRRAPPEGALP
jgi:uncharacterized membrane protein